MTTVLRQCFRRRNRRLATGGQFLAGGRDNNRVLVVRDENRTENDGDPRTVPNHQRHSDFQLFTVLLQRFALSVGEWWRGLVPIRFRRSRFHNNTILL